MRRASGPICRWSSPIFPAVPNDLHKPRTDFLQPSSAARSRCVMANRPEVFLGGFCAMSLEASMSKTETSSMDPSIQELLDKQVIMEQICNYGRSMDRLDLELGKAVFHPEARADY